MPHRIVGYPGTSSGGSSASGDGAADFDGTNDYMTRAGLTGAVDSKQFTFVTWFRLDATPASNIIFNGGPVSATRFQVAFVGDVLRVIGSTSGGSNAVTINATISLAASATWKCLMVAGDAFNSRAKMYIGDTDVTDYTPQLNSNIDFTLSAWSVGGTPSGTGKFDGCLSRTWFYIDHYIDFSVETNRRKFYTASGGPEFIGADGSLPLGKVPIMYHHITAVESADNYAVNLGSGGNFSVTGALSQASTVP